MKVDILAIGVHPDDIELSCSGTLLRHISQGKTVGLLDLTQGELGTRGSARIRLEEATTAAGLMGAAFRKNLGMADGFFAYDREHILKIIEVLREHQPEIVLANALSDRHPDHGRGGGLAFEACFLAGLHKIETSDGGKAQGPWRPRVLYHYIQSQFIAPDFVVDVSAHWEKKMEAVKAFKSQFYDPDSQEPETYISGQGFLRMLEARGVELGHAIGARYGEGFTVRRTIGVGLLTDIR